MRFYLHILLSSGFHCYNFVSNSTEQLSGKDKHCSSTGYMRKEPLSCTLNIHFLLIFPRYNCFEIILFSSLHFESIDPKISDVYYIFLSKD